MNSPIDGDALLARVKPTLKRARTQICLRPDLVLEWERLNEELAKSTTPAADGAGRLNGGPSATAATKRLAKQIVELESEIESASAWFEYEAMPNEDFRALCVKYPPRKDNQFDLMTGYDRDAVADVLIRKCLVDPVFTDNGWTALMSKLAPSEWGALRDAVFDANGGTDTDPKSQLASQILSRRGNASA